MQSKNQPACFYYPSTAVIVDDSERLLTKLSLELDANLGYVLFSQPKKALEFIKRNSNRNACFNVLVENTESETYGLGSSELQTKFDLSCICRKIYDPQRFSEPTVIVADYSMPDINGYELCQQLIDNPIKKIMLTGEADDALAVELFNQGVLNKFILKTSPDYGRIINNLILDLQKVYFVDQSRVLSGSLAVQSAFHLKDPAVTKIFHNVCQENNLVEYYMITPSGSCLLLSFEGTPYWFIVIDEAELHDYQEVAQDQKASASILKLLKDGKKIPYFPSHSEFMNAEGNAWEAYLYLAEKIVGEKTYYYAVVRDEDLFELKRDKILSFKDYLEKEWPPK